MKEICILCGKIANISRILGKDESSVKCDTCGIYIYDNFFRDSYLILPEYKRAMISAYTRERYERREETPKLADPDHLKEIILNYKNKTLEEKLDNLILYLKKKSRHFGDSIPWDEKKDYPITYSQDPSEFSKIREIATKNYELISWPARDAGLELTDKGWKKGEKLEEETKMELKEKRQMFLVKLWELTEGDENEILDMRKIGKELGFSNTEIRKISQYLEGENQIVFRTEQGEISISHEGIKEAEKSKFEKKASKLEKVTVKKTNIDPKKVFVVHGRNEKARKAIFDFLRSLGLDPIEWNEAIKSTGKATPFIGEVLDKAFEIAQAIIVLITGDDMAKLKSQYVKPDDPDYEKNYTPQARPNVIFEAGLAFGRQSERPVIAVLENEITRPFSDIYGRHLVKLSNRTESRMDIIDRLKIAGCAIDIEGKKDWTNTGDFESVIDSNFSNLAKEESIEQRKLEFTDEQLFVLALIVESEEEVSGKLLSESFRKEFPDAYVLEFKSVISWLEKNELITITGSIGGNILYVSTDKGIEHGKKELKRIKNYKKKIDEFKVRSKIGKEF